MIESLTRVTYLHQLLHVESQRHILVLPLNLNMQRLMQAGDPGKAFNNLATECPPSSNLPFTSLESLAGCRGCGSSPLGHICTAIFG